MTLDKRWLSGGIGLDCLGGLGPGSKEPLLSDNTVVLSESGNDGYSKQRHGREPSRGEVFHIDS
jgi:hypothetical protein